MSRKRDDVSPDPQNMTDAAAGEPSEAAGEPSSAPDEPERSYLLARTLERTDIPILKATVSLSRAEEMGDGARPFALDATLPASTALGSFSYAGCAYALIGEGRAALMAVDAAALPDGACVDGVFAIPSRIEMEEGVFTVSAIGSRVLLDTSEDDPIEAVSIPSSVTSVSQDAFEGASSLRYAIVSEDDPAYSSYDGCLYEAADGAYESLLLIPEGRTGVVRILSQPMDGVKRALSHCALTSVIITDAGRPDPSSGDVNIDDEMTNAQGQRVELIDADADASVDAAHPPLEADYSVELEAYAGEEVDLASALRLEAEQARFACADPALPIAGATAHPTREGTYEVAVRTEREGVPSYHAMTLKVIGSDASPDAAADAGGDEGGEEGADEAEDPDGPAGPEGAEANGLDGGAAGAFEESEALSLAAAATPDAKSASGREAGEYVIEVPDYGRAEGRLTTVDDIGSAWWEVTAASSDAALGTLRIWCEGGATIDRSDFAEWGDRTPDVPGAWGSLKVRRTVASIYMEPGILVEEDPLLGVPSSEGGNLKDGGITPFNSGIAAWFQCMPNLVDVSGAYVPEGVTNLGALFQSCTKLRSLEGEHGTFVIPPTVVSLHGTFSAAGLTTLPEGFVIPPSVKTARAAFMRCWQLVHLPEGMTLPADCYVDFMFGVCYSLNLFPASLVTAGTLSSAHFLNATVESEIIDPEGNVLATAPDDPIPTYYAGDPKDLDDVTDPSKATVEHALQVLAWSGRSLVGKADLAARDLWLVNFVSPTSDESATVLSYTALVKKGDVVEVPYASVPAGSSREWVHFRDGREVAENQVAYVSGSTRSDELYFDANRTAHVYLVVVPSDPDARSSSAIAEGEGYVLYVRGYGRATGQLATVGDVGKAWWEVTASTPSAGFGTLRIWCEDGATIASSNFSSWGDYTADVKGAWGALKVRRTVTAIFMEPGILVEEDSGYASLESDGGKIPNSGITGFGSGMAAWFQCMPNLMDVSGAYVPKGVMNLGLLFQQATKLETFEGRYGKFTIPSGVTTLHGAFAHSGLRTLPEGFVIPSSVLAARAAFMNCWRLTYLPEGFSAPENCIVSHLFANCCSLTTIPSTLIAHGRPGSNEHMFLISLNAEYKDVEGNVLGTAPSDPVVTYYGGDLANLDPVPSDTVPSASHAVGCFASYWFRELIGKGDLAGKDLWLVDFVVPSFGEGGAVIDYSVQTRKGLAIAAPDVIIPDGYGVRWVYYEGGQVRFENLREFVPGVTNTNELFFDADRRAHVYLQILPAREDAVSSSARVDGEGYVVSVPGYGRATGQLATVDDVGKAWWEVTASTPSAGFGTLRIWCEDGATIASSNFSSWGNYTADVKGAWGALKVRRTVTAIFMEPGILVEEDPGYASRESDGGKISDNGDTGFGSGMAAWFQCMPNLVDVSGAYVPKGVMNLGLLFQQATKLESLEGRYGRFSIPSGVTTLHGTFAHSGLRTLPEGFVIPSSVLAARAAFMNCWQLAYLPEGFSLSEDCVVSHSFTNCCSLSTIPSTLFVHGHFGSIDNMFLVTLDAEYKDVEGNVVGTAPSEPVVTYYGGDLANLDPVSSDTTPSASHAVECFARDWKRELIGTEDLVSKDAIAVALQVPKSGSEASGHTTYWQIVGADRGYKVDLGIDLAPKGYAIEGWYYHDDEGQERSFDSAKAVDAQVPGVAGLLESRVAHLHARLVGPIMAIDMPLAQSQVNLEARMGDAATPAAKISFRSFSTMKTNLVAHASWNGDSVAKMMGLLFGSLSEADRRAFLKIDIESAGSAVIGGSNSIALTDEDDASSLIVATIDPTKDGKVPLSVAGAMALDFGGNEIEFIKSSELYAALVGIVWIVETA